MQSLLITVGCAVASLAMTNGHGEFHGCRRSASELQSWQLTSWRSGAETHSGSCHKVLAINRSSDCAPPDRRGSPPSPQAPTEDRRRSPAPAFVARHDLFDSEASPSPVCVVVRPCRLAKMPRARSAESATRIDTVIVQQLFACVPSRSIQPTQPYSKFAAGHSIIWVSGLTSQWSPANRATRISNRGEGFFRNAAQRAAPSASSRIGTSTPCMCSPVRISMSEAQGLGLPVHKKKSLSVVVPVKAAGAFTIGRTRFANSRK